MAKVKGEKRGSTQAPADDAAEDVNGRAKSGRKVKRRGMQEAEPSTEEGKGEASSQDDAKSRKVKRRRTQEPEVEPTGGQGDDETLADDVANMLRELSADAVAIGEKWVGADEAALAKGKKKSRASSEPAQFVLADDAEPESKGKKKRGVDGSPAGSKSAAGPKKGEGASQPAGAKPPKAAKAEAPKPAKVEPADAAKAPKAATPENLEKRDRHERMVFLGNLPWTVSEETLRKNFEKFGKIEWFSFHLNERGQPAGTASIRYATKAEAEKVLLLDGLDYNGRPLMVKRRGPRQRGGQKTRAMLGRIESAWEKHDEAVEKKKQLKESAAAEEQGEEDAGRPEGEPAAAEGRRKRKVKKADKATT